MATERDTPEHRRRRREFCAFITRMNAERLVFIDESFCKTGMRREHGWSLRGQRVRGSRPMAYWRTIALVGAIRLGSKPLLMTHKGSVNGRVFLHFVRRRLVPWLRQGDVVVMDNLNSHKMVAVRSAIEAAGATPIYLPTYSPELNPIELLWPHLKRALRTRGLNDEQSLRRAAVALRTRVPLPHIEGWFRKSLREAQIK